MSEAVWRGHSFLAASGPVMRRSRPPRGRSPGSAPGRARSASRWPPSWPRPGRTAPP